MDAVTSNEQAAVDESPRAIAEQGKRLALRGRHAEALGHYQRAINLGRALGSPPLLLRHFLECALESMELAEMYDAVLAYCDEALAHYRQHPPEGDFARADLAHIQQRRAVCLARLARADESARACAEALRCATEADIRLPLTERLAAWLDGGYHISASRLLSEQRRHGYFSVRRDTVAR